MDDVHQEELRSFIRLCAVKFLYLIVDRNSLSGLSSSERSKLVAADLQLLERIKIFANPRVKDVYIASNEASALASVNAFRGKAESEESLQSIVNVSPELLFPLIRRVSANKVFLNFGTQYVDELSVSDVEILSRVSYLCTVACSEELFIVQAEGGAAMSTEIEGACYALGFLAEEDGRATLESLKETNSLALLEPNLPGFVANKIFTSADFDGLILNPGSESQKVLSKEDLRILEMAADIIAPRGVKGWIKRKFLT